MAKNKLPDWWNYDELLEKANNLPSTSLNTNNSISEVDSIIQQGESPDFIAKPEDAFKLPNQLSTISKLRKQGYDDTTIIESLKFEEAQASSTKVAPPKPEGPIGPPEKAPPTFFERFYLPTLREFQAGGAKQKLGGYLQSLGAVRPQEEKEVRSVRQGFGYTQPEITIEEAKKKTLENPIFKAGLRLYAQGLEDFENRPDLQPSDNPFDYNYSDPRFIASAIGEAIPSLLEVVLPATIATAVTKNPSVGMATMVAGQFGIETGSMMNTAMEEGLNPGDASNVAITVGMINGLISTIPAYGLFQKLGFGKKVTNDILVKQVIKRGLYKNVSKNALEQGLREMTEEVLQEGVNIIAEETKLGRDISSEEIMDRMAMASIGALGVGGITGGAGGAIQSKTVESKENDKIEQQYAVVQKLTLESEVESINKDSANDFNIQYDKDSDGRVELSEDEIKATGYEIDINELPVSKEDENGKKFYAVKIKGENDIESGIRLTNEATRSTLLEETVEFRVKKLQSSKNRKDQQLVQKIDNWAKSLRNTASKLGLKLRFADTVEGNLELFSDAMVYHKGGYSGLNKDIAETTYIPDDLANEFIDNFGKMSDGTNVFDLLKGQDKNVQAKPEIQTDVDSQLKQEPKFKKPKIIKNKTNQLEPDVVKKAVGLYPSVIADIKNKAKRIKLTLSRRKKNPKIGRQNNNRVEIKLKNGGVMILGRDKTPQDWIKQVDSILDENEVKKAMNWYEDAYPAFVEEFGNDQAINYMVAWLLGNVQASPQQALSNTFLGAEQLKAELPSFKSPGTSMVADNIKNTLQGVQATKGAGAKLYDFLDSALGKPTRTIMQDNPDGLMPVAIDRHTFRDAGFIDGGIRNMLKRLAVDPEKIKRLRFDSRGSSPSDTQYEYAVKYMNDLTKELNKMGYMGGNLKPHQVQAIGWTAIARMSESSEGQSIPDAIGLQKPTVAFELEFGTNSSYDAKYGTAFKELPKANQIEMTNKIVNKYIPQLATEFGIKVNSISSEGFGFWGDVDKEKGPSANATMDVRGSDQAIKGFMNSIGILFQQDEVGLLKKGYNLKGLGLSYSHPELSNPEVQEAVYNILREETSNEITPGAVNKLIDGVPSLVVGTFINQDQIQDYADEISTATERIRTELGLELNLSYGGTRYESTANNWETDPNGERYRDKALETHKQFLLDRLDNHYGPKIEASIERYLKQQTRKDRKRTYQLEPDPDAIADLEATKKVQDGQTLDISEETTSAYLKRKIFDKLYPVVSWQKDVEEQFDVRLQDSQDVALAGELFIGKVSERLKDINKDLIDLNNKDSFLNRLSNDGIKTEDFNLYLHAKHAKERNKFVAENNEDFPDGGSGLSSRQADVIKRNLNKKYTLKKLRKYENEFRKNVIDKALNIRLENGLISQQDYENLTGRYKNYVPLFRVLEESEAVFDASTNKTPIPQAGAFDVKGSEFKRSKGSSRAVKNIFVSSIEQLQSAIVRAEKNRVNQTMLSLVESYPSDIFEVQGVKQKPVYDKNGEIDYMVPVELIKDSEGNRIPENQVLHVKVNGKTKRVIFKGEQGGKIAYAMKDLGTSRGIKGLYAFNGYLRYVNTIANPEFMVANFLRDIQTAGINISAEQGNAVLTTALSPKNLGSAWRGVYKAVAKNDTDNEWGQLYERLRKAGGKTGFFDYQSIEEKVAKLEESLKRVDSKGIGIKSAGKNIFSFVENINEATESAVRLTLFKSMLDNGFSEAQSASGAKNVTINFNRKGEVGQWLNSLYLFSNASLQGTWRIFGVVAKNKVAQGAVTGLGLLGFTEAIMNNMASEDDDEYEKLPNWTKDNNFIMRYGPESDKFFKIRLPYGYNVFKVIGNIAGDIAWRQMQGRPVEYWDNAERFLSAMNSSFNPLGSSTLLESLSPTVADPLVQLSLNKDFSGAPIKPQNVYGPYKAEIEQSWKNTPNVYKNLSQAVFKTMGGKIRYNPDGSIQDAIRGPLDWMGDFSPEHYEYFVKYLTGGAGKFLVNSVNTISTTAVDYNTDYANAPFIRQFYQPFSSKSESRILYEYEKNMGRKLYTYQEQAKYYNYLESFYYKNLETMSKKEFKKRRNRFRKAQKERERNSF